MKDISHSSADNYGDRTNWQKYFTYNNYFSDNSIALWTRCSALINLDYIDLDVYIAMLEYSMMLDISVEKWSLSRNGNDRISCKRQICLLLMNIRDNNIKKEKMRLCALECVYLCSWICVRPTSSKQQHRPYRNYCVFCTYYLELNCNKRKWKWSSKELIYWKYIFICIYIYVNVDLLWI